MSDEPIMPVDEPIDPLSNYEPFEYADPLEEALAERPMTSMRTQPFVVIRPDVPVYRVLQAMAGLEIACVLIGEHDRMIGMFTQRDVLVRVVDDFEKIKDAPISDVMTRDPVVVYDVDCAATALCAMAVGGHRHVPVVNMDKKIVGVVGPRRMTAFVREHFESP
jgi:CBS domain-containing protein